MMLSTPRRKSIKTRLLVSLLGLITLAVVLISLLAVNTIFSAGRNAQEAGKTTLRNQAEEFMVNLTTVTAEKNDLEFERARRDVEYVTSYASAVFSHPDRFNTSTYWRAEDHMALGRYGHSFSREGDLGSTYVPPSVEITDEVNAKLEQIAQLDSLFVPIFEGHPNAILVYLGTTDGIGRFYPYVDVSDFPGGDAPDVEEEVLTEPFFAEAAPEKNPERAVVLTSDNEEILGLGLIVTASGPIYSEQGEFVGVIGLDLSLAALTAQVESSVPIAGGYSFLIDEKGQVIALPEQGYTDLLGRSRMPEEVGPSFDEVVPAFAPVGSEMSSGETGFQSVTAGGRELFVSCAPMPSTGWSLAHVVETSKLLQVLSDLESELDRSTQSLLITRILPVAGLILILALALGLWLTGRLVAPIQRLAVAARQIGEGNWDQALSPGGDTSSAAERDDEVGQLAQSFQGMSERLKASFGELEERLIARTQEMAALFDVTMLTSESQEIADLLEPALSRIIELGSCQGACIHLFSEEQTSLMMVAQRALSPTVAARLQVVPVELGFKDWVCRAADPVLVIDLGASPLLPPEMQIDGFQTYLGAQLRARGAPQGLLSCYRESGEQFLMNEVSLLVALAEQLGMVIENHRLYQRTRALAVLEERERMARDMHDSVTQSLYGLTLFARAAREAAEDDDRDKLERSLTDLEDNSLNALKEMRLSLYQLRPAILEAEGLARAVEVRLEAVEKRLGMHADLQVDGDLDLPVRIAEELYHIAIEALNNILKHAEAGAVNIRISSDGKQVRLEIHDDGRGFDVGEPHSGMGVRNMTTRAEILRGVLEISSAPGDGTLVRVTIDMGSGR